MNLPEQREHPPGSTLEQAIVAATRAIFDERGRRDASLDDIARAAGVSTVLVYDSFESKEDLFVLVLVDYLNELEACVTGLSLSRSDDPALALRQSCECYIDFCLDYPVLLDCVVALWPASELRGRVSESVRDRLHRAVPACLEPLTQILASGAKRGVFAIDDAAITANRLCAQLLGSLYLARVGFGIHEAASLVVDTFEMDPEGMRDSLLADSLALSRLTAQA
jgi:AcrR family transcriptional regulator